ncbi:two-component sensor histidine kinase, partial [Mediterraneibacter faecis]|nr:two-component sensor histidine kinase [Mediterraneibacter faecis]
LNIFDAVEEILDMEFGENEWLQDIQAQTSRLADLTYALVMLSRMEEGVSRDTNIEFPLSDIVEEVCHTFEAPEKVHQIILESKIEPL